MTATDAVAPEAGNASMALADQSVVSACNFATMLLLARALEPAAFGRFSLALLVCLLVSSAHWAVFTQPMNVFGAAESRWALIGRLRAVLRAHGLTVPAGGLLLVLCAPAYFPDPGIALAGVLYLACFSLQEALRRYWYTNNQIKAALINDLVSYGGQVIGLLALISLGSLTAASAFVMLAATSLLAFAVGVRSIAFSKAADSMPVTRLFAQHWPLSKWLLPMVVAVWGAANLFPFLMTPLGAAAIASFIACRNALQVLSPLVQSLSNYLPIVVARLYHHQGIVAVRTHLYRTSLAALVVGLAFLLLSQILAGPFLALLYGGRFDDAAPMFRVLAIGTTCSFFAATFGSYALALKDSRSNFLSNAGAMVVTCAAGPYLIATWGLAGAAWGATMSAVVAFLLQAGFVVARLAPAPRLARR